MLRSRLLYASGMDVLKMLADLRQERAQIEEAIIAWRAEEASAVGALLRG
jgi:hypothetical protein